MAIWNGLTETGAVVPIQVDDQGRVVVSGGGGIPSQVYGTAKASGSFLEDGTTEWAMNLSCSKTAAGTYVCAFATPMADTNYAVFIEITMYRARSPAITARSTSSFEVKLIADDGNSYDAPFNAVVFDNKPTDVSPLILPVSALNDIERLKAAVGLDDDQPVS